MKQSELNNYMVLKNFDNPYVHETLERLGFIKLERKSLLSKTSYYCWFEGKKRVGNSSPTIEICLDDGVIAFCTPTTYVHRAIPAVLLEMFERNMIEVQR